MIRTIATLCLCLLLGAGAALAQDNGNGSNGSGDNLQDRTLDTGGTSGGNR